MALHRPRSLVLWVMSINYTPQVHCLIQFSIIPIVLRLPVLSMIFLNSTVLYKNHSVSFHCSTSYLYQWYSSIYSLIPLNVITLVLPLQIISMTFLNFNIVYHWTSSHLFCLCKLFQWYSLTSLSYTIKHQPTCSNSANSIYDIPQFHPLISINSVSLHMFYLCHFSRIYFQLTPLSSTTLLCLTVPYNDKTVIFFSPDNSCQFLWLHRVFALRASETTSLCVQISLNVFVRMPRCIAIE